MTAVLAGHDAMFGRPPVGCLNCGASVETASRFCAHCGQRTDTSRLTVADILRDLLHAFVNIERGPFAFAWALLVRPGQVAREFVAGRRRRYYGPFATLAVVVGLTTLAINVWGYELLAHDGLTAGPETLMQRHFNIVLLAQLPLLGGACAWLFRPARLNLCEHMVLAAYTLSVRAAFIALMIPLSVWGGSGHVPDPWQVAGYWAAWYAYFGWAAARFYAGAALRAAWLRGAVAAGLAHAAISLMMWAADLAYRTFVLA